MVLVSHYIFSDLNETEPDQTNKSYFVLRRKINKKLMKCQKQPSKCISTMAVPLLFTMI